MNRDKGKQKTVITLLVGLGVGFFAIGFAMVPLYGLLCEATGVNSISSGTSGRVTVEEAMKSNVDEKREVIVEFDTSLYEDMPWEFRPLTHRMKVHPGKLYHVSFFARNNSDKDIVGQAIPGITPWQATGYFHKTECFCFQQQPLKAGEGKQMDLVFVIDSALPEKYSTVTLSYAFMDTANGVKEAPPLQHEPIEVSKLNQ
jgi:cytochrome c oxidase assembly protein subunit 11